MYSKETKSMENEYLKAEYHKYKLLCEQFANKKENNAELAAINKKIEEMGLQIEILNAAMGNISTAKVPVTGVIVSSSESTDIKVGESFRAVAAIAPAHATNTSGTWSSNNTNASVDDSGLVTGLIIGSSTITFTTSDGGFTDSISTIVGITSATSVEVTPIELTVQVSEQGQLSAEVLPLDASDRTGIWSSDSASVTVDSNGLIEGISEGQANVTFTTTSGGYTSSSAITVETASFDSGIIINGLLNDASDITLQSRWTIANNLATYDGTSTSSISFNLSPTLIVGETYTLKADISNASTYAYLLIESRNSTTGTRTQFLPYTVINNGTSVEIVSFTFTGTDVDQLRVTARASSGGSSFDSTNWSLIQGSSEPDTEPPTVPTNLTTTSISDTSISLAWSASTDNVGVSQYNIYVDGVLNKNTTALNTTVTGLTALTAYDFTVSAEDSAGNESAQTSIVQGTTTDTPVAPPESVVAFPGAEGYGKNSVGGRGGTVYIVTSLADSGANTLRAACEASGPRIVTFAVGGRIDLLTPITITNPNITIAGQTAPGDGIMITGNVGQPDRLLFIDASDVIIRYLTFRRSESSTGFNAGDCILIWDGGDIMIDHCSVSWSSDGNIDIVNQEYGDLDTRTLDNITVQHCLFTNSYGGTNKSNLLKYKPSRISWFRNAHVNSKTRNPAIAGNDVDRSFTYDGYYEVANCIFYDAKDSVSFSNGSASNTFYLNFMNNASFQETGGSYSRRMLRFTNDDTTAIAYVDGNIDGEGRPSLASGDEWDVAQLFNGTGNKTNPPQSYQKALSPYSTPLINDVVSLWTADTLVANLMPAVGNSIQGRDAEDTRAYNDVINLTSTFNNTTNTFPTIANGTPPTDSNGDGISDAWALANMPVGATANDTAPSGYTYIEEYLNSVG